MAGKPDHMLSIFVLPVLPMDPCQTVRADMKAVSHSSSSKAAVGTSLTSCDRGIGGTADAVDDVISDSVCSLRTKFVDWTEK